MTICWTVGLRRHASSSAQVPRMFVSSVETGFRFATPTVVCAARWSTVVDFVLAQRALERLLIAHVAAHDPDPCRSSRTATSSERGTQSRTRQTTSAPRREELPHQPAADEPGRAGDEDGPVPPEGRRGRQFAIPRRQCESPPEGCRGRAGPGRCVRSIGGGPEM